MSGVRFTQRWIWGDQSRTPLGPLAKVLLLQGSLKEKHLNEDEGVDHVLLEALAACYENASHWSARRQILSIFAVKVSFKIIQQWLPDVTRYRYNIARHHLLLHGRGVDVPLQRNTRIRVPLDKLDHFLTFITSSRIVQDLLFWRKNVNAFYQSNKDPKRHPKRHA